MDEIKLYARGKINLMLDVTSRRSDGYHDIITIMQPVELSDIIKVRKTEAPLLVVESDCDDVIEPSDNIALKALKLMKELYHLEYGFYVYIEKRIPIAAGMGGGSSDAAAVLKAVNILCDLGLSKVELMEIGKTLGADVPFCIFEECALAQGIGDKLTPIIGLKDCEIVLVNPNVLIPTKQIYDIVDEKCNFGELNPGTVVNYLEVGDLHSATRDMINIMQSVTAKICPRIDTIIDDLKRMGAIHAMMSGSGATCFGIFTEANDMENLKKHFKGCFFEVTRPLQNSKEGII